MRATLVTMVILMGAVAYGAPLDPVPWDPFVAFDAAIHRSDVRLDKDFDVVTMDVDLTIDIDSGALLSKVDCVIECQAAACGDVFFYLLKGSFLKSTSFDGEESDYTISQGVVTVTTPNMAQGETHTVSMTLSGTASCPEEPGFQDQCSFGGDIDYFFMYGYATPYFFAYDGTYEQFQGVFSLSVADKYEHLTAASSGILIDKYTQDKVTTFVFDHPFDIVYHYFAIADYTVYEAEWEGVPVRAYLSPDNASMGPESAEILVDILAFHSEMYSPYKFPKLDMVDVGDIPAGGYGVRAGILLNGYVLGWVDSYYVAVAAHEIGHQWWGSYVDFSGPGAVTMTEGLAEFSACTYVEAEGWESGCFFQHAMEYKEYVPFAYDTPLADPNLSYDGGDLALVLIYGKAPVVMNMWRTLLGDEAFFGALEEIVATKSHELAFFDELLAAFGAASGDPDFVETYLSPWFMARGYPTLDVTWSPDDAGVTIGASCTEEASFDVVLPVTLDHGGVQSSHMLGVGGDEAAVVETDAPVTMVAVTPPSYFLLDLVAEPSGDLDGSGIVDGNDLLLLAHGYLAPQWDGYFIGQSDADGSGYVDEQDLDLVLGRFGLGEVIEGEW